MLTLFTTFFRIGLFTFGGGYAMIPLMEKEILIHGWLTQAQFLDIVAVAEMTPGPISINSATFVGYQVAGVPGAALATLGVVTPSLIIMIIFAKFLAKLKASKYGVSLRGVSVAVTALIAAAVVSLFGPAVQTPVDVIFALIAFGLAAGTKLSPIYIILLAGIAGVIFM
ncbi:MAG: chromate transporter [Firmicutes bacterium]|nr:chromate transporter [Bacillota bacterium]